MIDLAGKKILLVRNDNVGDLSKFLSHVLDGNKLSTNIQNSLKDYPCIGKIIEHFRVEYFVSKYLDFI